MLPSFMVARTARTVSLFMRLSIQIAQSIRGRGWFKHPLTRDWKYFIILPLTPGMKWLS